MHDLTGQVAFITGAARGQGRSHAQLLAEYGADIVAVDICDQVPSVGYPMSTRADLDETVKLVEAADRRILPIVADVRDHEALATAAKRAVAEFGRLDIVLANAGVMGMQRPPYTRSREAWGDALDIMLTGVWNTLQATVPLLIEGGRGGAIVITSSAIGINAVITNFDGGHDGYIAAKFGVIGLMRAYAGALAKHNIRVNTIHPTGVATPMVLNDHFTHFMQEEPEIAGAFSNALPVASIEPIDISRSILHLVSESGRYITGHTMVVDCGSTTVAFGSGVTVATMMTERES
jgi:(+)-trans-carveol dehydrogenase